MRLVRFVRVALLTAFAAGCASTGGVPRPFPGAPAGEAPPTTSVDVLAVVQTALGFRGVPYRSGGTDPSGFDCSGLVQYVFAQHGVGLPREVREQYQFGSDVRLAGIEAGDLVFFATAGNGPSHVGLAIGGDQFIHAPSTRGVVRVERFSAPYWASRIVGIKRVR